MWGGRVGGKGINQGRRLFFQTSLPFTSSELLTTVTLLTKRGQDFILTVPKPHGNCRQSTHMS